MVCRNCPYLLFRVVALPLNWRSWYFFGLIDILPGINAYLPFRQSPGKHNS